MAIDDLELYRYPFIHSGRFQSGDKLFQSFAARKAAMMTSGQSAAKLFQLREQSPRGGVRDGDPLRFHHGVAPAGANQVVADVVQVGEMGCRLCPLSVLAQFVERAR